jgi:hypothetical protein
VHQALVTVLATLDDSSGEYLRPAAIGELRAAPGQAVVRHWSSLSPETQHNVFEAAVRASGETLRPALARPA